MSSFTLETDHGLISVTDTAYKNNAPALLLLHGNSSSSRIFRHILDSKAISSRWRIVTFDLPGHGSSSKAPNPERSYYMRGYADLAVHILQHLNIEQVVIFGWSLGGHIGIEMVELLKTPPESHHKNIQILGLMITGTPPVLGREQVLQGFNFPTGKGDLGAAGVKDWTDDVALEFSRHSAAAGKPECWEPWMVEDAKETDGRARMMMARRFTGVDNGCEGAVGVDQRKVVESEDVLIAVVNGGEEQYVNLNYVDEIKWKRLWKGKCLRLEGLHHAPFWEDPERFEKILIEFVDDATKVASAT